MTTPGNLIELTAESRQILEGPTNVPLRWNFSLTADLNLILITLSSDNINVATVVPSAGIAGIQAGFEGGFNVTWILQRATLIIFNVTADENGEFGYALITFQGANNKLWKRKTTVEIVGKFRSVVGYLLLLVKTIFINLKNNL